MRTFVLGLLLAFAGPALAADRLLLDSATVEQLDAVEGVSPELAEAIVGLRAARGGHLTSIEELRVLPGADAAALEGLRRATRVEVQFPTGAKKTYASADEVLAEFAGEPTIQDVQGWANEYARTSPHMVDAWLSQSRMFAALPQVDLEYRLRSGWDLGYQYYPTDGAVDDPADDVFDILEDAGEDQDAYYTVRASWNLDELVMSSERIRMINEVQDIVKLRDKVLSEVTSLYFERRRLQAEMLLSPKADVRGQVGDQLRLLEMTANLDALTGGRFSEALRK
jgi:competence protein ComEA